MIEDVVVFDGVAHPFNLAPGNAFGRPGQLFANRMVFAESETDMSVAMPLSLTDLFADGLSPLGPQPVEHTQTWDMDVRRDPGKLLFWCGEDKIVYGGEAPISHPRWALRAFMDFQIPQDLCEGYGYPRLTDVAKRKILGENLLRLHGMDLETVRGATG